MPAASQITTSRVRCPSLVEREVGRPCPDGGHELLAAFPIVRRKHGAAVVADHAHADDRSPAGAIQMLAEALVSALGLFIAVRADEPIEDLPDRQRQIVGVFVEHAPHLIEQR
jgi:hypothetical protein